MKERENNFEEMVYTPSAVSSSGSSSTSSSILGVLKLNAYVEKSQSSSMYNINYSVSCSNASNINVVLAKHPSGTIVEQHNYSYGTSSTFFGVDVGSYLVKATASRGSATKSTQVYTEVGRPTIVDDINVSIQTSLYTDPKNVGYDDMLAYWIGNYYITVTSSNAESITASLYCYSPPVPV